VLFLYSSRKEVDFITNQELNTLLCSGESFGSLSTELQKRYLEKYRFPERFFRTRDGIESVPYKPQNRER